MELFLVDNRSADTRFKFSRRKTKYLCRCTKKKSTSACSAFSEKVELVVMKRPPTDSVVLLNAYVGNDGEDLRGTIVRTASQI